MVDLTLVVVAANPVKMREFRLDNIDCAETVLLINYAQRSLASIGNQYLQSSRCAVFGLVHADMYFGSGSLQIFGQTAMTGAVCGACGKNDSYPYPESYRWANRNPGPVSTLDSSCMFCRTDIGLLFDQVTFDGFHLHVEDLCLQAKARGIPVIVPPADAAHGSPAANGAEWQTQYFIYYDRLQKKWPNVTFATC